MRLRYLVIAMTACGGGNGDDGGGGDPEPTLDPTAEGAPFDDIQALVEAYHAAHPDQDGDVNAKSNAELAADPDALRLVSVCGVARRPIFPLLSWEYGGNDHPWIAPEAGALAYCVYLPASPSTDNWSYDGGSDHVVADVYVKFAAENPCAAEVGADQVAACIGDPSNFEILVDMASKGDGANAGLSLSESSTELRLILTDGSKVHLASD